MLIAIIQVGISLALIVLILLQERSAGLSGIFGGDGGGFYQARRGFEKAVFVSTVVLAVAFAAIAILQLLLA